MVFLITPVAHFFTNVYVFTWDAALELTNLVLPKRKMGHVVLEGHPGFGGEWPEFKPPQDGDSRCACPALNALANHGALNIHFMLNALTGLKAYFLVMAATSLSKKWANNAATSITFLHPSLISYPIMQPIC